MARNAVAKSAARRPKKRRTKMNINGSVAVLSRTCSPPQTWSPSFLKMGRMNPPLYRIARGWMMSQRRKTCRGSAKARPAW